MFSNTNKRVVEHATAIICQKKVYCLSYVKTVIPVLGCGLGNLSVGLSKMRKAFGVVYCKRYLSD